MCFKLRYSGVTFERDPSIPNSHLLSTRPNQELSWAKSELPGETVGVGNGRISYKCDATLPQFETLFYDVVTNISVC